MLINDPVLHTGLGEKDKAAPSVVDCDLILLVSYLLKYNNKDGNPL